jgi:HEPN pEK499 p136
MAGYKDFNKDVIERTIEIVDSYDKIKGEKYEVTLLINCLTGLLVLPKEILSKKKCYSLPDSNLEDLKDWGIKQEHIKEVSCTSCGYKLNNIVRHMRNSVAHMRIESLNDASGKIVELRFKDSGFKAEIPIDALEEFVKKLAGSVINKKDEDEKIRNI